MIFIHSYVWYIHCRWLGCFDSTGADRGERREEDARGWWHPEVLRFDWSRQGREERGERRAERGERREEIPSF